MLFLNRRGYAGFLSCRACGHVIKCPHCDVSLSLHRNGRAIAITVGMKRKEKVHVLSAVPVMWGEFKAGTQQIEEVVRREFSKARYTPDGSGYDQKKMDMKRSCLLLQTEKQIF